MDDFLYKDEGFQIIKCFYAVYNTLGAGFLESVYQEALSKEFGKNNVPFVKEKKLEIYYNEDKLNKFFKADFICYNDIIVEVKAQKFITKSDTDQVINYLSATKYKLSYLVNFGAPQIYYRRMIHTDRRQINTDKKMIPIKKMIPTDLRKQIITDKKNKKINTVKEID